MVYVMIDTSWIGEAVITLLFLTQMSVKAWIDKPRTIKPGETMIAARKERNYQYFEGEKR